VDVLDGVDPQRRPPRDVVDSGAHGVDVAENLCGSGVRRCSALPRGVRARQPPPTDLEPLDPGGRHRLRPQQKPGDGLVAAVGKAGVFEALNGSFGIADVGSDVRGKQDLAADEAVGLEGVVVAGLPVAPGEAGEVPVGTPAGVDEAGPSVVTIKLAEKLD